MARSSKSGRREDERAWALSIGKLFVPVLLAVAVYFAVFGGEYSVFELRAVRAAVEVERAQLADVETRIDSLSMWADSLRSDPETIERVAREDFGMIREGETLYRFAEPDQADAEPSAPAR